MSQPEGPPPDAERAIEKNRQQSEFEMEFFHHILARHPEYVDVLKRQAQLLASHGRRFEALACHERLAAFFPGDPQVRYHLACSLAAVGRTDDAVQVLADAIELGYRDFDHLESDPDLEALREHPQFQALLRGQGMGS